MPLEDLIKEATRTFAAQLQEALEAMAEDLARAAVDDRDAAVARATETLNTQLAEARAAAKADIDRAVADEVERARAEVEDAAVAKIAEARADALKAADARVAAAVADAQKAADARVESAVAGERTAAAARVTEARDEAQKSAEAALALVRSEAEASVELARARAATEAEAAAASTVTSAVAGERQHQLFCSERLLGVIRTLDQASSLTEVLATLAEGAAAEAPRVAVLTLHGERLRGWRFLGFSPEPARVDLELAEAGVIGRAVHAGEAAVVEPAAPGHAGPAGPAFAALPPDRSGIALPLVVGGATVAVLYADDATEAEQTKPASWPETIEILGRHAAARLENLTAVRTAQAFGMSPRPRESAGGTPRAAAGTPGAPDEDEGARRYARLLVSEIKLYNESAVRLGRQKRDLGERLRTEISRARHLYEDRVPPAVRRRRDYFDEELVQTLAGGDAALLGRRSDALA